MLLAEQERLLANEKNLIKDPYNYITSSSSWVTLKDYGNVTLTADSILVLLFHMTADPGIGSNYVYVRVKIGSLYVCAARVAGGFDLYTGTAIYLAAGTYDILFQGRNPTGAAGNLTLDSVQVGLVSFNDVAASYEAAYSSGIALTVNNRTTPMGPLSKATYFIQVLASTSGAVTNLENVGENLTNGVSISVDGTQQNWSERYQDTDSVEAASGKLAAMFSVGASHTVTISKRNASTGVNISVIACPWLLTPTPSFPITTNFSQGSTVYVYLEPLYVNATKTAYVGAPRAITFGSSTDYYSTSGGTGLILWAYTMDIVDVSQNSPMINGLGGCVGIIAVDIR
jgi:hypothetical protein